MERGDLTGNLRSLGLLLALLPEAPGEFRDRAAGYAEMLLERILIGRVSYDTVGWEGLLQELEERFGDVGRVLSEPALREVEERTRRLLADIRGEDPFMRRWAADSLLARLCYLLCRLLRPRVVLETGVAYGVSSAFILRALEQNGGGVLHSVDLPPLRSGYEKSWGVAVDEGMRRRWCLHRGSSRKVLPGLLERLGRVDLFVHDSLHTRSNMLREFGLVWPHLTGGGVLVADDVERNDAFGELRRWGPDLWRVVEDRERGPLWGRAAPVVFGVAIR